MGFGAQGIYSMRFHFKINLWYTRYNFYISKADLRVKMLTYTLVAIANMLKKAKALKGAI